MNYKTITARRRNWKRKRCRTKLLKLTRQLTYSTHATASSFWIGLKSTEKSKQNFTNTDYAFKLYNQAHPDKQIKEPRFIDFYQPSQKQKQGMLFGGGSMLTLGYSAF